MREAQHTSENSAYGYSVLWHAYTVHLTCIGENSVTDKQVLVVVAMADGYPSLQLHTHHEHASHMHQGPETSMPCHAMLASQVTHSWHGNGAK